MAPSTRVIQWSNKPKAFVAGCLLEAMGRGILLPPNSDDDSILPLFKPRDRPLIPEELFYLLEQARSRILLHPSWRSPTRYKRFWWMVTFSLRFRGKGRNLLCHKLKAVVLQSFQRGISFISAKGTEEAEDVYRASREVTGDLHRSLGFIRLFPFAREEREGNNILVGRCESPHEIGDLLVPHFARRNIGWSTVILLRETAWCALADQKRVRVWQEKAERYRPSLDETSFEDCWRTFYDSQYAVSRKNQKLAQKHLPKKFWGWVPEGRRIEDPDGEWR